MSVTTRTKTIAAVSTTLFIGTVGALLFLVYRIDHDALLLEEKSTALALREAQEQERLNTVRLLEDTSDERTKLASYILTEEEIIDFINNFEQTAKQQQLDFVTQTITPVETPDPLFNEIAITMAFTGDKEDVMFLLQLLETLPYLSSLESVAVRQSNSDGRWSANVALTMIKKTP